MDTLQAFFEYAKANSSQGSNLAGSYVRALRYATELLRQTMPAYGKSSPIWEISSIPKLEEIYKLIKEEERKGTASVFSAVAVPKSYWQQRYCSSAIRMFARFLTEREQESEASKLYADARDANTVAASISKWKVNPLFYLDDDVAVNSRKGRDIMREVKTRQNQSAFRRIILLNYGFACCVTGLPVREVLRASHIVGWSENVNTRLLPTNGLCLAASYDAAFDRHLISFDEDYRMVLAPSLKEYCTNAAFAACFKAYEGKKLIPALKFQPSQEFLALHRAQMK